MKQLKVHCLSDGQNIHIKLRSAMTNMYNVHLCWKSIAGIYKMVQTSPLSIYIYTNIIMNIIIVQNLIKDILLA